LWLGEPAALEGLATDRREVLVTTALQADPAMRHVSAEPSLWPLVTAVATTGLFIGSIFHEWALVWGSIPVAIGLIGWLWPIQPRRRRAPA
jgi:cytochrome c oxidase subunit I+III